MKLKHYLNHGFLVVIMLLCGTFVDAADRYSVASGNWSSPSTWSATRGGTPGASVPGVADNVFIDDTYEVSVDYDAECNNITIGFGTGGILNIGRKTTQPSAQSLYIHGNMTINTGASVIPRRNNVVHALTISGNITNNGTAEFSSSKPNGPVCNVTMNSAGSITVGGSNPVYFNDLTINSGCAVTLSSGGSVVYGVLLCNGSLSTGGNLTLGSTDIKTALVDGSSNGLISGVLTMERYIASAFGYKYFASPFMAATVNEFADEIDLEASFPELYSYEEESLFSGWTDYSSGTGVLNPLEGYAVNLGVSGLPLTVDLSGEVNNGPVETLLYNHNNTTTQGFSLAGNPYPSPIDWDAVGWIKSNIDDAIWYFRASTTDQYGGAYSSYVNGVSSDGAATNIIPSMQGFFVHVTDGSYPVAATLGVSNSVRINDLTHEFLKSATADNRILLRLYAAFEGDTSSADPVAIYFDEMATTGYDFAYDALKMLNTDWTMINLYSTSSDGRQLSIDALPVSADSITTIPLNLLTYIDGDICFTLADRLNLPEQTIVSLVDNFNETEIDLDEGPCVVTLDAGEYNDRFSIIIKGAMVSTGIVSEEADPVFSAWPSRNILKVVVSDLNAKEGKVEIYNINGSIENAFSIYDSGYYEFSTNLNRGIYLVRYSSGDITVSKKIFMGE